MISLFEKCPDNWSMLRIDEIAILQSGTGFPPYAQGSANGTIPFLKVSDMNLPKNSRFIEEWNNSITEEQLSELKAKIFPAGAVIFPKIGGAIATNKKRVLTIPSCFDNNIMGLKARQGVLDEYLYWMLQAIDLVSWSSSSSLPSMKASTVKEFLVPVPTMEEQKRIVEKLDVMLTHIDTVIGHLQESVTLTDALVKSSLSSMITRQEHWDKVSLSDVCQITSKLCDPREEQYLDMLHIGGANITSFSGELIDLKTARDEKLISGKFPFDNSMVLYSKIRPYLMKVARPSLSGICSADIYPLTPDNQKMSRDFLFYLLLSDLFTQYAIEGSSRAGMPKVNRNHLFNFEFYLPPIDEQKSICESLDALVEKTNEVSKELTGKLSYLAGLKASILDSAFKGEL
ncbi:restriction endonuclease subunit S [Proteus vulgaris]|uniref:restriction endonuclease subunit S n=1 Tax=Proteus vulgaris TaxID=585 RepID=UPI0028766C0D|nr:restriction endonuclease subunit S [Proteus vulgaris]MDS0787605.1 restriction endonuclease subunit S [Proteus vulgaris]